MATVLDNVDDGRQIDTLADALKTEKKKMKMSEALKSLDGKVQRIRGALMQESPVTGMTGYCALGALMHYAGIPDNEMYSDRSLCKMLGDFGVDNRTNKQCPYCGNNFTTLMYAITHMNDNHHVSFSETARVLERWGY